MVDLGKWKPWNSEAGGEGKGGSVTISSSNVTSPIDWSLAPSKSHMIRWLLLAAQGEKEVALRLTGEGLKQADFGKVYFIGILLYLI